VELVARPTEASQTQALEAMVGLQVGEAHFHSFPLIAGPLVLRRIDEGTGTVTGLLVDVAGYFASRDAWATLHLHRASIAIELARPIEDRPAVMHPAGRPQDLAVRAPVLVLLFVEREGAARERPVIPLSLLPYWDVRGDTGPDQSTKELAGSIGCVRQEPFGFETELLFGALDHRLGRP
jgi:hypothetical protein